METTTAATEYCADCGKPLPCFRYYTSDGRKVCHPCAHKASPPMTDTIDVAALVERLNHAATTAANDDLSEPMSDQRRRHAERFAAMVDAATALQSQADALAEARRDLNKYAYERDKAREERDAAERRSDAFWKPQVTKKERLERLVRVFLDNNPDELVADSGETVLDLFRHEARRALGGTNAE